jgi:hypothetical protein
VLLRLESASDQWQLATHETMLRRELKLKTLGLSSLQWTITRQESRILCIREGDAPTAFSMPMPMPMLIVGITTSGCSSVVTKLSCPRKIKLMWFLTSSIMS